MVCLWALIIIPLIVTHQGPLLGLEAFIWRPLKQALLWLKLPWITFQETDMQPYLL